MTANKAPLLLAALLFAASGVGAAPPGANACAQVAQIRYLPFRPGELGRDAAYDQLWSRRAEANACLVELVASTERMPDPREEPTRSADFRVGDLAFFLLLDFNGLDLEPFLPAHVAERLRDAGVFAYFEWIAQPGSRGELLRRCRAWLDARAASEAAARAKS